MPRIGRHAGKGIPLSDLTAAITIHRRRREPVPGSAPEFYAGYVLIRKAYARRRQANVIALKKANEDDDSTVTFGVRTSTTIVCAQGDFIIHGDEVFILRRTQPLGDGVGFELLHAAPYSTLSKFQVEVADTPIEIEIEVMPPESPVEAANPYW